MTVKGLEGIRIDGIGVLLASVCCLLFYCCCSAFDNGRFNNFEVSGYVKTMTDSTAIPGALVLVNLELLKGKNPAAYTYTDSLGYFEYFWSCPTEQIDSITLEIIAADIDGEENGIFLSKDTLLIEDDLDASLTIVFEAILYVEMIGE